MLSANIKRKASCQKVGGEKKRRGHKVEDEFMLRFGVATPTTYKAEADCSVSAENPAGAELMKAFPSLTAFGTSVKSGSNLQFTLGRIDEVTHAEDKIAALKTRALWEKYLGKSTSAKPAQLLAYREESEWVVFEMDEVLDFITSKCEWRQLESGRMKGNFADGSKKGVSQYLTYEYRETHGSYFLGANGNKGKPFIRLLTQNLRHIRRAL
jgi:hypothetical protein